MMQRLVPAMLASRILQSCLQRGAAPRCFASPVAPGGRDLEAFSPARQRLQRVILVGMPLSIGAVLAWGFMAPDEDGALFGASSPHQVPRTDEVVVNWSGTHEVRPRHFYQPETSDDVEAIVAQAAAAKRRLRVVGSALSPNGIAFSGDAMMSMALLDRVISVDAASRQVRVQAGCRVQQVADELKPYGLTLQNFASIREQQIGGFTQVSAHGTGAAIPPVDEQVVALTLVTPGLGKLELSRDSQPELFHMARVGLGCLGVVTELTLQATPLTQLAEHTFVASAREVRRNHARWLTENRHLRYMWLPYTDSVVVVQVNPADALPRSTLAAARAAQQTPAHPRDERLAPLRALLRQRVPGAAETAGQEGMSATELRDVLLALDPLNPVWVAQVNRAEAEHWKRSAGWRFGAADEILGFDCGGQQWVLEVAFPCGRLGALTLPWARHRDLDYMADLMGEIKSGAIPAHAPIEQRWTSSSASPMSPASAPSPDTVHSWVGIIMYLPTEEAEEREAITASFKRYVGMVQRKLMPTYGASWHWAKIEAPEDRGDLAAMRSALAARFPLERFNAWRAKTDPDNILANDAIDALLGTPQGGGSGGVSAVA